MKNYCTFLFADLLESFNTFDHGILCQRLLEIGLSNQAAGWFSNGLSDRKQFITLKKTKTGRETNGSFSKTDFVFSFTARERVTATTFLPLLDYGDIIYMNASAHLAIC